MDHRPYLLDVSRLIWRRSSGRLPTGIDRVCLAYLAHFRSHSLAVLQWRGWRLTLSPRNSERLFEHLLDEGPPLSTIAVAAIVARQLLGPKPDIRGKIYWNVGHTGLDAPGFGEWIARSGIKPIFLVHDLIPITHPQYCRPGEDKRHGERMAAVLRHAGGIVANSGATLAALTEFAAGQSLVVPPALVALLGVDPLPDPHSPPDWPKPYFVTVGTIEARKNHLLLLRLWRRLVDRLGKAAPTLVIVGQRGWEAEEVFRILDHPGGLANSVVELGSCDDRTLAGIIDGASALLMPSFEEGFGIPLVEALQRGTPAIASDLPVYREVAGDIPLYLDPTDLEAWEGAISAFLDDTAESERQRRLLRDYSGPDWPAHFQRVEAWISGLFPAEA